MVCSIGNRGMAAMARLLAAAGVSQKIAEDVAHWDLATNYFQRQLREADEANLLNEEDMHVFGLKPMADPLQLARCNACNRPVKSSRFAAHADLCKFLSASEGTISELDGGTSHRKPPRKKKKKSQTTSTLGDKQRLENSNDVAAASEPHSHEQNRRTSFSVDRKRNSPRVDGALVMNGSGLDPEKTDQFTVSMPPPTKREMITAEGPKILDQSETVRGETKSLCPSTQKQLTSSEHPSGSSAGCETNCANVSGCQRPSQVQDRNLTCKGDATKLYVPAPMATKIYYSQSNQDFRAAITHLYYQSSTRAHFDSGIKPQVSQSSVNPSCSSSPKSPSNERIDDQQEKREKNSLPSVQKPDEIVDQSTEIDVDKSGACQSAVNNQNQLSVNNVLGPDRTPNGLIDSNHLSNNNHETFDSNSGKELGKIQQPKGSAPVSDKLQVPM